MIPPARQQNSQRSRHAKSLSIFGVYVNYLDSTPLSFFFLLFDGHYLPALLLTVNVKLVSLFAVNPNLISALLSALSGHPVVAMAANPYSNQARLSLLEAYLQQLCALPYSGHLLVGEAPGYNGCALTGIPFTSERVIQVCQHPLLVSLRPLFISTTSVSERTATIVWNHLCGCRTVPAFWNAFPFHPHNAGTPHSNRTPSGAEITAGLPFLSLVLQILTPHTVIAVGSSAASALLMSSAPFTRVRHPSYGGKANYITGVTATGII
jgi:uracil-DNA glycosylase